MTLTKNRLLHYRSFAGFLLFVYALIQVYCINQLSVNYDEGSFASYGTTLLKLQREKNILLFDSKLPITALNMIPRAVEQVLKPNLTKAWPESLSDVINGRYISLFVAILLGLLIYSWSKKLYDEKTALFVLATYLLCPNFLAHGIFVSSDIFACFFMAAALFSMWLFFQRRQFKYFLLMCLSTGFAEVSKFSMFHLFLLIPFLFGTQLLFQNRKQHSGSFGPARVVGYALVFLFVNWLIICTSHLFYQVFIPINNYAFQSNGLKHLQQQICTIFPRLPVPLPSSYINSMDAVMYFDSLGGGVKGSLNGAPYILGASSVNGFWYYYFVAIFFKVPIPLLVIWLVSIVLFFINFSRKTFFRNDIFLVAPALYFLIYMNFFYSTQVGIRHLLIIFPLLFVLSGKLIQKLVNGRRWLLLYSLLIYQAISVLSYFPHFLPYTNEFIADKKMAYKKIADTNICYGEGTKFLQRYLIKYPEAIYMPEKPMAGKVVMEVNEILNLHIATVHKYDWARSLIPVDHIHSQYLVFNVSKQTADSLNNIPAHE